MNINDNFESVIRYYSDMVYRISFAKTGNKYDADDIFQEVFLRYIRKKPVFKDEQHRKAWFIRVTVNCANSLWSSPWRKRVKRFDENVTFEMQINIDLYNELQKLPEKYREVIHLFYYENMSVEEIGKVLGRKSSTVRTQLTRGRKILKNCMEEEDYV